MRVEDAHGISVFVREASLTTTRNTEADQRFSTTRALATTGTVRASSPPFQGGDVSKAAC